MLPASVVFRLKLRDTWHLLTYCASLAPPKVGGKGLNPHVTFYLFLFVLFIQSFINFIYSFANLTYFTLLLFPLSVLPTFW